MSRGTGGAFTVYTSGMSVRISSHTLWRTVRRAAIIAVAVVLLHALAIDWADRHIQMIQRADQAPPPIAEVQLPPPLPTPAPTPPVHKPFKAKPKPKPQQEAPPPEPEPSLAASPPAAPDGNTPSMSTDGTGNGTAPGAAAPQAMDQDAASAPGDKADKSADQTADDKSAPVHYKLDFPPSVELTYDVELAPVDTAHPYSGSGTINWQNNGNKYQIVGDTRFLMFVKPLKFTSEGGFDSYGIAPVLYSEKKINRSETATHFNRDDRNNISFSASQLTYRIKGGEQDTASVVWQIAAIGRGDREKFVPNTQIDLFVAGTRDADIWSILVIGQEDLEIDHSKVQTWHVARMPRPGTYDRRIDIWLAPQDQWYPVKIRQTEKKGDVYDMTMTSYHELKNQAAQ